MKQILRLLPCYERLVAAVGSLLGRFDAEIKAKREFKEIVAGRRPPAEAAYSGDLAIELRAQLKVIRDYESAVGANGRSAGRNPGAASISSRR